MREAKATAERLAAFSDGVFAVIVTIMVLELKAPEEHSFSALLPLWPIALSYAVSYLFVAIIWINHHHLMRFVGPPTLGMIWVNFVHLFLVSLLPFATAWVATTQLASSSVMFYAGLFICIDAAYNVFEHQVLTQADASMVSARMRRTARPIADRPCGVHVSHAGCDRRPARRLRSDMRGVDAALAAGSLRVQAVTDLQGQRL
jgi:uncharacterized membrane protein